MDDVASEFVTFNERRKRSGEHNPGEAKVATRLRSYFLSAALGAACFLVHAQQCPAADQPDLATVLGKMINGGRADDAMQCVITIAVDGRESGAFHPEEVRYQLAKLASDAIEALGGEVFSAYHSEAAMLWDAYLENLSEPYERSRITFGITKLMQHGRSGPFHERFPVLAKAMAQAKAWITPSQSDQLFTIVKRCPNWHVPVKVSQITCATPCPAHGRHLLDALALNFGRDGWSASEGARRLATNAKALEGSLVCKAP
jgi:hypothetical protein